MFVPSLSWQKVRIYVRMAQIYRFAYGISPLSVELLNHRRAREAGVVGVDAAWLAKTGVQHVGGRRRRLRH
jgi:hypothetical protein